MLNSIIPASWLTPCTLSQLVPGERFVYGRNPVTLPQYACVVSVQDGRIHIQGGRQSPYAFLLSDWGHVTVWVLPASLFSENDETMEG